MNGVVITICMAAVLSGLFKMLVPDGRFKPQISFLTACLFSVCVLKSVTGGIGIDIPDIKFNEIEVVDFSEKLSENAEKAAANAVKDSVNELLEQNGTPCSQIYIVAHINGSFGISINEIELVFEKGTAKEYIDSALFAVREKVGDEILVRYSFN